MVVVDTGNPTFEDNVVTADDEKHPALSPTSEIYRQKFEGHNGTGYLTRRSRCQK